MINTSRLHLRQPTKSDFSLFSEILSSVTQSRYLPKEAPYTPDEMQQYLDNRIAHWQDHGFGTFVYCFQGSAVGFSGVETSPKADKVDIRFGVIQEAEGQGFTTEATCAALTWTFQNTHHTCILGAAMPENQASIAVLKKIGMKPSHQNPYHFDELTCFELHSTGSQSDV